METIMAGMFFVSITVLIYSMMDSARKKKTIKERMNSLMVGDQGISLDEIEMSRSFMERILFPIFTRMGRVLGNVTPERFVQRATQRLARAGYPKMDPRVYLGIKGIAGLGFATLFFVLYILSRLGAVGQSGAGATVSVFLILFSLIGYMAPDFWLRAAENRRKQEISCGLPDLLDLLTVSVEAGLGFEQALMHSAEKMKGAVSTEIKRLLQDMRIGMKHSEAFRALADRVMLPDLKTFCAALIQADQLGVSIAEVLRVQSESMRRKRRQRAEETAMKAPIKLLIPLVLFIFPTMFIVLLGPAVIKIMNELKGTF